MPARLKVLPQPVASWAGAVKKLEGCLGYLQEILKRANTKVLRVKSGQYDTKSPLTEDCDPPYCPAGCLQPRMRHRGRQIRIDNVVEDLKKIRKSANKLHRAMTRGKKFEETGKAKSSKKR